MRGTLTIGLLTGFGIIVGSGMAMAANTTDTSNNKPADNTAKMTAPDTMSKSNVKLGGTLHLTHGMLRTTQLDGATIYNDKGKSVGTLKNILVTTEGSVTKAVISSGGHMIEVPFSKLKFEKSNPNPNPKTSTADTAGQKMSATKMPQRKVDYSVVYPGATKASLKSMPKFHYFPKNG